MSSLDHLLTPQQLEQKRKRQAHSRQNYLNNRDTIRARIAEHYRANREKCIERVQKYNQENPEKVKEYAKKYYQRTKEEKRERRQAKRAKEQEHKSTSTDEDKAQSSEGPRSSPKKTSELYCDCCDVTVKKNNRYSHFISTKHLKKLKAKQDAEQQKIDTIMTSLG